MSSLQTSLLKKLSANGWLVRSDGGSLSAERDGLLKQWVFGKRSIKLHLAVKFDERSQTVFYTESAVEESTGWAPKHLADTQIGIAEHAEARKGIERACQELGWRFAMMPKATDRASDSVRLK